jgi:hypothetical protein
MFVVDVDALGRIQQHVKIAIEVRRWLGQRMKYGSQLLTGWSFAWDAEVIKGPRLVAFLRVCIEQSIDRIIETIN